ncbi:tRNA methyltransferase [Candidatus Woesearchaeota archaeon]|nr:MAG: tRNA methyltransferase [Candidatus Woesearchaeota archaeon]
MLEVKPGFRERYVKLIGEQGYRVFMEYNSRELRRSIRVNTLKISIAECKRRLERDWVLTQIPWCSEGFWVEHKKGERKDIGNTPEYQLGYYYVQEAASMIPPVVLQPQPGELVLDMCAAPGSKATQLAQMMQNQGLLVANDYKGRRLAPLGINLQRCGVAIAVVTLMRAQRIRLSGFDRVLLDAPCSGTGAIRKSLKTLISWNPKSIKHLAGIQRGLIATAYKLLKPGGVLVYSTCSLEPEENEEVVDYLLKKFASAKLLPIELNIKRSPPILEFEGKCYSKAIENCLRIWPQDNDTEGFFIAKILKTK